MDRKTSVAGKMLIVAVVAMVVIGTSAPVITDAFHAAVPVIIIAGCVAAILRIIWYLTDRY